MVISWPERNSGHLTVLFFVYSPLSLPNSNPLF
jgi:hypothetical protein